jgi:hypothetical protein
VTRNQALSAAAALIIRTTPDLDELISLLGAAGQTRLATALREQRPPRVGGGPGRLDIEMWRSGRLR